MDVQLLEHQRVLGYTSAGKQAAREACPRGTRPVALEPERRRRREATRVAKRDGKSTQGKSRIRLPPRPATPPSPPLVQVQRVGKTVSVEHCLGIPRRCTYYGKGSSDTEQSITLGKDLRHSTRSERDVRAARRREWREKTCHARPLQLWVGAEQQKVQRPPAEAATPTPPRQASMTRGEGKVCTCLLPGMCLAHPQRKVVRFFGQTPPQMGGAVVLPARGPVVVVEKGAETPEVFEVCVGPREEETTVLVGHILSPSVHRSDCVARVLRALARNLGEDLPATLEHVGYTADDVREALAATVEVHGDKWVTDVVEGVGEYPIISSQRVDWLKPVVVCEITDSETAVGHARLWLPMLQQRLQPGTVKVTATALRQCFRGDSHLSTWHNVLGGARAHYPERVKDMDFVYTTRFPVFFECRKARQEFAYAISAMAAGAKVELPMLPPPPPSAAAANQTLHVGQTSTHLGDEEVMLAHDRCDTSYRCTVVAAKTSHMVKTEQQFRDAQWEARTTGLDRMHHDLSRVLEHARRFFGPPEEEDPVVNLVTAVCADEQHAQITGQRIPVRTVYHSPHPVPWSCAGSCKDFCTCRFSHWRLGPRAMVRATATQQFREFVASGGTGCECDGEQHCPHELGNWVMLWGVKRPHPLMAEYAKHNAPGTPFPANVERRYEFVWPRHAAEGPHHKLALSEGKVVLISGGADSRCEEAMFSLPIVPHSARLSGEVEGTGLRPYTLHALDSVDPEDLEEMDIPSFTTSFNTSAVTIGRWLGASAVAYNLCETALHSNRPAYWSSLRAGWMREEAEIREEGARVTRFLRMERADGDLWYHLTVESHQNISFVVQGLLSVTSPETDLEATREVIASGVHRAITKTGGDVSLYRDVANVFVRDFMAMRIAQVERERGAHASEVELAELNRQLHNPTRPGFWRRTLGWLYDHSSCLGLVSCYRPTEGEYGLTSLHNAATYYQSVRRRDTQARDARLATEGREAELVGTRLARRAARNQGSRAPREGHRPLHDCQLTGSRSREQRLDAAQIRYFGREPEANDPAALLDGEVFDEPLRSAPPPRVLTLPQRVAKSFGKATKRATCGRCARLAPLTGYKWRQGCCPACHQEFAERANSTTVNAVLANNGWQAELVGRGYLGAEGILLEASPKPKPLRVGAKMYPLEQTDPYNALLVKHLSQRGLEKRVVRAEHRSLVGWEGAVPALPQLAGIGFLHTPSIMAKSSFNLDTAVMTRLCAQPPVVAAEGFWETALKWVQVPGNLDVFLPGYEEYRLGKKTTPLSFDEWVRAFPAGRQKMFRKAMRDWMAGRRPSWKQLKSFSVFVKRELANNGGRVGQDMPKSNPRSICNPPEMTHALLGRFLRPITTTAKTLAERGPITYDSRCPEKLNDKVSARWIHDGEVYQPVEDQHIPGLRHVHNRTPLGTGKKFVRGQPTPVLYTDFGVNERVRQTKAPESSRCQLSSDYSMMDSSYGQGVFKWLEHILVMLGLPCGGLIFKLWRELAQVSGTANGKQFTAGWINASGRDDTALINFLVNMFLSNVGMCCSAMNCDWVQFFAMPRSSWEGKVPDYAGGAVGDDLYVDFPREWESQVRERFEPVAIAGGFTNKIEFTYDITHLVFLGNRPYPTAVQDEDGIWRHRLRWGKQLGRCLYKLGWQRMPSVDCLAWMKGVAWAALISNPHVPILRAYAISVLEQTDGVHMRVPQELWKWRMPAERRPVTVTPYTFDMLQSVYGLSKTQVALLEHALLCATLGEIINNEWLMQIFEVDKASM